MGGNKIITCVSASAKRLEIMQHFSFATIMLYDKISRKIDSVVFSYDIHSMLPIIS